MSVLASIFEAYSTGLQRATGKDYFLRKKEKWRIFAILAIAIALGAVCFRIHAASSRPPPIPLVEIKRLPEPTSIAELLTLPPEKLARLDIAQMNLLCAEGLPGTESMKIQECLERLDYWASLARANEAKYKPAYYRNPAKYESSLAKFKAIYLGLMIKEDLKVGYNMDLVNSGSVTDLRSTRFFANPDDLFLQGFTKNGKGSCASLPVLMVALGRKCGYPLYLVSAKAHLFCRWDDGKERFNIEITCPGVDIKPDSYYRTWPYPFSKEEERQEKYLRNFTPLEELGSFLGLRAMCLKEHGRLKEAADVFSSVLPVFPESQLIKSYLYKLEDGI